MNGYEEDLRIPDEVAEGLSSRTAHDRYTGLGFDPTPGDPGAVEKALRRLANAGYELMATGDPGALAGRVRSMGRAANALITWVGQLADNKRHADALDRVARVLRHQLREAVTRLLQAQAELSVAADRPAARVAVDRAGAQAGWVRRQLDAVIDQAHTLRDKHLAQAEAAATGVSGGPRPAGDGDLADWTGRAAFVAALLATGPAGLTAAGVLAGAMAAEDSLPATSTLARATDFVLSERGPSRTRQLLEGLSATGPRDAVGLVRALRPETFGLPLAPECTTGPDAAGSVSRARSLST